MNLNSYVGNHAPPHKNGCRRQNSSKSAKHARRRRVELRRIRSVPQSFSSNEMCLKKIRSAEAPVEVTPEPKSYGQISVVGRRREMDQVVAVELGFLMRGGERYDFFGVFEGRGGWRVARACGQRLHKVLAKIVEGVEEVDWEGVMAVGFNMMDDEVNNKAPAVGATAVVALVGKDEVVVASCGGSRVVLSRGGAAVQLLDDYKPNNGDIAERTSIIGLNWNRERVHVTSRALEAKVRVVRRSDADELLILGSDGLWDVIPNDLACQVARKYCHHGISGEGNCENGGAEAAAALLAEVAVARGSRDNISIIVVDLKTHSHEDNATPAAAP